MSAPAVQALVAEETLVFAERLPAASKASTASEYVVAQVRPGTVEVRMAVDPMRVPLRYTPYPATPTSSVDALHASVMLDCEELVRRETERRGRRHNIRRSSGAPGARRRGRAGRCAWRSRIGGERRFLLAALRSRTSEVYAVRVVGAGDEAAIARSRFGSFAAIATARDHGLAVERSGRGFRHRDDPGLGLDPLEEPQLAEAESRTTT